MKDGWIKPDGEFIEVRDCGHNEYASDLLEKEMGLSEYHDYMDNNNLSYPYEVLHLRGWIRVKYNTHYLPRIQILGDCIDLTKPMKNTDPPMNEAQLKIAKDICNKHNTLFHVAINDKRFW